MPNVSAVYVLAGTYTDSRDGVQHAVVIYRGDATVDADQRDPFFYIVDVELEQLYGHADVVCGGALYDDQDADPGVELVGADRYAIVEAVAEDYLQQWERFNTECDRDCPHSPFWPARTLPVSVLASARGTTTEQPSARVEAITAGQDIQLRLVDSGLTLTGTLSPAGEHDADADLEAATPASVGMVIDADAEIRKLVFDQAA